MDVASATDFQLVPRPAQLTPAPGSLRLADIATVTVSDPADDELRALGDFTRLLWRTAVGVDLTLQRDPAEASPTGRIELRMTPVRQGSSEAYQLAVSPTTITISAAGHAGLFYGVQTLRQLLPPSGSQLAGSHTIPAVTIRDEPRFEYRGMHLDVGRHTFPVAFIKRYLDLMAMYKLNTFHWHLTEDQGWRIEIEGYPRLTEIGSCRKETILEKNFDPYVGDDTPYCGFYTQDEVREIVAYAADRFITVIPEIEMPGHSLAALAAYPEFACTPGPFEVATTWGVHEDIYCPKEETFAFLENVLLEVLELFPSTYVHIGGDEAPKARWEESEIAQEVIRREGLADEHELQSWFIQRIEQFLLAHGRRLIGWDEILEGGLAPEATVMSWRGMAGGIEAARHGHDVVMTPTSHVYFDYYQGDPDSEPLTIGGYTPLEKVYAFEPVPDELSTAEAEHVLGAQGNVWTEYMKTPDYVEYMVFPRLLALSEVVWTPRARRDWDDFTRRLPAHFRLLGSHDVNFRIPHVRGLEEDRITLEDQMTVTLETLTAGSEIRYTLDGTDPTPSSLPYEAPLQLDVDEPGVTVTARAFLPNGRSSTPRAATFRRTALRPPAPIDPAMLSPGVRYLYFESAVASVDSLVKHAPVAAGAAPEIGILDMARDESMGFVFTGYLHIDREGIYTFHLTSDDGSTLHIGSEQVIDHDGFHGPTTKRGMVALAAGYHPITVGFFQGGAGRALRVQIAAPDSDPESITSRLYYER
jgi:hexosaminidase